MLTRPSLVPAPPGITKGLFSSGRLFTLQNMQGLLYRNCKTTCCATRSSEQSLMQDGGCSPSSTMPLILSRPVQLACCRLRPSGSEARTWDFHPAVMHCLLPQDLDPVNLEICSAEQCGGPWRWLEDELPQPPSPPITAPLKALSKSHLIVSQPCLKIGFKYCTKCSIRNVSLRTDPLKLTVPYNSSLEIE
jgi:hypothetical protein